MPLILLFAVSLSKESTLFVHQSFPHECAFENTSFIFTFLVLGYCGRFNCKEYPTPDIRSSEGVMRSLQATAVMHLLFPPSSKVFSTENGFCRSLEHQTGKGWPFFSFSTWRTNSCYNWCILWTSSKEIVAELPRYSRNVLKRLHIFFRSSKTNVDIVSPH